MDSVTSILRNLMAMKWTMRRTVLISVIAGIIMGTALVVYERQLVMTGVALLARYGILQPRSQGSTILLSYDQMLDLTDIVFIGKVTNVSKTSWNQDSGQFWLDTAPNVPAVVPLQIHFVDLAVDRYLLDKVSYRDQKTIQLAILGVSPVDNGAEYSLKTGDTILVFARRTEIAWREGERRPVITFLSSPDLSYFNQQSDGSFIGKTLINSGSGEFVLETSQLTQDQILKDIRNRPAIREFEVEN